MLIFELFQLLIICAFLYIIANLVRYCFFKESNGGGIFGLSDKWIEDDKFKEKTKNGEKKGK